MPRLSTPTILRAYQQDPLLPLLLRECRTIDSARNELRWLRQHALDLIIQNEPHHPEAPQPTSPAPNPPRKNAAIRKGWRRTLREFCHARSRGTPLQYLLGDQPFGDLTILCKRGVLIPRNDTETFTYAAASQILQQFPPVRTASSRPSASKDNKLKPNTTTANNPITTPPQSPLRILDLCTGTGCIALLLHTLLSRAYRTNPNPRPLKILGLDNNPLALRLAYRNLMHNLALRTLPPSAPSDIEFHLADVLSTAATNPDKTPTQKVPSIETLLQRIPAFCPPSTPDSSQEKTNGARVDVIISNPPYISARALVDGTTARSVRVYEPLAALVPPLSLSGGLEGGRAEDVFYARIVGLVKEVGARMVLLECGDYAQGERVVQLCRLMVVGPEAGMGREWEVKIWEEDEGSDRDVEGSKEGACLVVLKRVGSQ